MRITLFNVSSLFSCSNAVSLISALLKRSGHTVRSVFMARREPVPYDDNELEPLGDILKDSDLVMVSVWTPFAIRAVQLTEFIRKRYPGLEVVWGGPHCVSAPELSLRHADVVCFAEGDEAAVELVGRMEEGGDYLSTPNFAFKINGKVRMNKVLKPFGDLDRLPFHDLGFEDKYLLDRGLFQITEAIFKERIIRYPFNAPTLSMMTSRGCPFACTFCNNIRYISMYSRNPMRFMSVSRFMDELEHIVNTHAFYENVAFGDDDFAIRPLKDIEEFAARYRKRIGLPFSMEMCASSFKKEKLEVLLDAGLKIVQVGVQSGSQRVLDEVFARGIKASKAREVIGAMAPYRKTRGLEVLVDFIIDNPYETEEDIIQTYRFIIGLPREVRLNVFRLAFYPGSPLYERAVKDGYIEPYSERESRETVFNRSRRSDIVFQKNYETFLVLLARLLSRRHSRLYRRIPGFVLRALGAKAVRRVAKGVPLFNL